MSTVYSSDPVHQLHRNLVDIIVEQIKLSAVSEDSRNRLPRVNPPVPISPDTREYIQKRADHDDMAARIEELLHLVANAAGESQDRVAYLGPKGSQTYVASRRFFGKAAQFLAWDPTGGSHKEACRNVIRQLKSGAADFAVIAIDNPTGGTVMDNVELLHEFLVEKEGEEEKDGEEWKEEGNRLRISAEMVLRVEHCLLGSGDIKNIREIHSHEQALSQCKEHIEQLKREFRIPEITLHKQSSTAAAAEVVAQDTSGKVAAISHKDAAEIFGLHVLREHMEDEPDNMTRFLVIGGIDNQAGTKNRTSIWFTTSKSSYQIEAGIAGLALPVSKSEVLEDFPAIGENSLFLEVEGHITECELKGELDGLEEQLDTESVVLGSYPQCRDYDPKQFEPGLRKGPKLPVPRWIKGKPKIGIIGVAGRYGKFLKTLFEDFDHVVVGSDPSDPKGLSNKQVVEQSDVVIFSVSLNHTIEVITELAEFSHSKQLWIDVTSVKQKPIEAMLGSKAEVIGLHPMCSPSIGNWREQPVVVCKSRCPNWGPWLSALLEACEADIQEMDPGQHDREMAFLQVIPHAMYLLGGAVLRELECDLDRVLKCRTPTFSMMWYGMNRVLSNAPELCADLQMENREHAVATLKQFVIEANKLLDLVEGRARNRFVEEFMLTKAFIGDKLDLETAQLVNEFVSINNDVMGNRSLVLSKKGDRPGLLHEVTGACLEELVNMTSLHSFSNEGKGYRFRISTQPLPNSLEVDRVVNNLRRLGWEIANNGAADRFRRR